MKYVVSLSEEEFEMLDKFIDDLYDQLHQMSKEELKQWYLENAALQPFEKEIDGTVYTVNSHYSVTKKEALLQKSVRLLGLKILIDKKYIES